MEPTGDNTDMNPLQWKIVHLKKEIAELKKTGEGFVPAHVQEKFDSLVSSSKHKTPRFKSDELNEIDQLRAQLHQANNEINNLRSNAASMVSLLMAYKKGNAKFKKALLMARHSAEINRKKVKEQKKISCELFDEVKRYQKEERQRKKVGTRTTKFIKSLRHAHDGTVRVARCLRYVRQLSRELEAANRILSNIERVKDSTRGEEVPLLA